MEKKEVIIVWDYPQLTEDPMAVVIDPETGNKIDEATLDCTNFVTGGKLLIPGTADDGSYEKNNAEEDQFLKDNSEFLELPLVEDRYLSTCWGKGILGVMETCQEIFLKHFNMRYNVKSITKLRKATV